MPQLQVVTFLTVIVCAVVIITLERRFPYTIGLPFFRDGFWDDFFWYTIVQSYVLGLLISWFIQYLNVLCSGARIQLLANWSVWMQLAFFLVTHDIYIYLFHRWQHRNKFLWRIHEAHHSPHEVDWLSGSRSHPLEIVINQTIEFAPIVLLGAAPEVAILKASIDAVWGMYIHSNIDVHSGWLQRIVNGPEMHRWHHSGSKEAHRYNFATKLAVWDWMFGTAYLPGHDKPLRYGLRHRDFPRGYLRQVLFLFRPFSSREAQARQRSK